MQETWKARKKSGRLEIQALWNLVQKKKKRKKQIYSDTIGLIEQSFDNRPIVYPAKTGV